MPAEPSARSGYLALASFAQSVVDALLDYVKSSDAHNLGGSLQQAGSLLDALIEGRFYAFKEVAPIRGYEQFRALREVWAEPGDLDHIRGLIQGLRQGGAGAQQARDLVQEFMKLERYALWCMAQPPSPIPARGGAGWGRD